MKKVKLIEREYEFDTIGMGFLCPKHYTIIQLERLIL